MVKIVINGFGRIGRPVFRRIFDKHPGLEVVAINDLTDTKTLAHLLKYDSTYGRYNKEVSFNGNSLIVNGKEIKVFAEKDPADIPSKKLGADIVLECTGVFTDREGAGRHLKAGARQVIISAPAKDDSIPSYLLGVNAEDFNPKEKIVDMGSCTTNCIAPIAKILNDNFKILKGFMTTVHSYTNDQRILDLPHKDLRRARAAAINIIPTSTGAAKALGKVIPSLKGKLDGIAMRVPTAAVSSLDLVVQVENPASKEEITSAFKSADLEGILSVCEEPLVSSDFIGDSHSAIIDQEMIMVNQDMVKIIAWYDNEWGYSCRLAEFAEFVGKRIQ
ncbi:type I glyceraldehyde-3-phosphate dehydrogenase [Patescibacteria group bacterium]|nr:type I glyceraldehyde-3-phosphate dehydrogenase [Patescibacteria group bacterium]